MFDEIDSIHSFGQRAVCVHDHGINLIYGTIRFIQIAIDHGGRYFPTDHRWATREQVVTAYPQFVDFLRLKKKYDPSERFPSELLATWGPCP